MLMLSVGEHQELLRQKRGESDWAWKADKPVVLL